MEYIDPEREKRREEDANKKVSIAQSEFNANDKEFEHRSFDTDRQGGFKKRIVTIMPLARLF